MRHRARRPESDEPGRGSAGVLSPGFVLNAWPDGAIVAGHELSEQYSYGSSVGKRMMDYSVVRGDEISPVPRREGAENTNTDHGGYHRVAAPAPIRVVVCDDHDLFRRGVVAVI